VTAEGEITRVAQISSEEQMTPAGQMTVLATIRDKYQLQQQFNQFNIWKRLKGCFYEVC